MSNETLNIGIESAYWFNPKGIGGIEKYAQRLTDGYVENGQGVVVYTGENYMQFPKNQDRILRLEGKKRNIPVYYHKGVSQTLQSVEEAIEANKVDILQIEDRWGVGSDIESLKRILNLPIPIVWVTHNQNIFRKGFPYRDIDPEFAKLFFGRIDRFVGKSQSIKNEIVSFGVNPEKVSVVYNPVDSSIFHPVDEEEKISLRNELGLPLDKKIVLYVGRFSHGKGTDFLMDNWESVHKKNPNLHLVLVGEAAPDNTAMLEQTRKFREQNLMQRNATLSNGFVTDEKVLAKYYQACDVFLQPSHAEGLGNVLIEAMACAKPCVISEQCQSQSGAGEIVLPEFNGAIFQNYNDIDLFEAISRATVEMGENGFGIYQATGFESADIARQHQEIYKRMLNGNPYSVAMIA